MSDDPISIYRGLIASPLPVEQVLPAAAQGAIGIQCRRDDHVSLTRLLPLNDPATSTSVETEREIVAALGADCHSSVAVLAHQMDPEETKAARNADSHWFRLRVRVLSPDGLELLEADEKCKTRELRRLTKQVVTKLKQDGAGSILG